MKKAIIQVYMRSSDREIISWASEFLGISMASFCRELAIKKAKKLMMETQKQQGVLNDIE